MHAATNKQEDIDHLRMVIEHTSCWHVAEDTSGRRFIPQSIGNALHAMLPQPPSGGYTEAQLAAIDPRLPGVMWHMHMVDKTLGQWTGVAIRITLRLWDDQLRELPCDMFGLVGSTFWTLPETVALVRLTRDKNTEGAFDLVASFSRYTLATTGGPTAWPYVSYVSTCALTVSPAWLDTNKPGWRDQLLVAQALELSSEKLAQMLLFDQPAHGQDTATTLDQVELACS